jgi:flavin reductase (DIM6/NTAB) family NADH-FMN oxidoreductase RutF
MKECLANIECWVVDLIDKDNIVVLEAVAAYEDPARKEKTSSRSQASSTRAARRFGPGVLNDVSVIVGLRGMKKMCTPISALQC